VIALGVELAFVICVNGVATALKGRD